MQIGSGKLRAGDRLEDEVRRSVVELGTNDREYSMTGQGGIVARPEWCLID